jgi:glucokinase
MIGIDLGGSNLRAAKLDGTAIVARHREPVGEPRDPQTIVEKVARVVESLAADGLVGVDTAASRGAAPLDGAAHASGERRPIGSAQAGRKPFPVGIGIAAMLSDRRGTVANSPHLRWRDVLFGELLRARLGPAYAVVVTNDVNAILWGEAQAGAARGCRDVLGVYVGTGIGGAVIANGALVEGVTNSAGEIGHTKVRWDADAAPCQCGQRGCIEAYLGGSYLLARIARETGTAATPDHVDRAAAGGEPWARALWHELAPLLSIAIGNAVALMNPERVVLGGGVLARCPELVRLVTAHMAETTNGPSWGPLSVVLGELGDDAGLVGAAHLASVTSPSLRPSR